MKKVICNLVVVIAFVFTIGCGSSSDSKGTTTIAPDTPVDELVFSKSIGDWEKTSWGYSSEGSNYWTSEDEDDGEIEYAHVIYSLSIDSEGFAILTEEETEYEKNDSTDEWVRDDIDTTKYRLAGNGWIYSLENGEWKVDRPAIVEVRKSWTTNWTETWDAWNNGTEKEKGTETYTPLSLNIKSPGGTANCIQIDIDFSGSWSYTNTEHPENNDTGSWSGVARAYFETGVGIIEMEITEDGYGDSHMEKVDTPDWYTGD